MAAWKAPKGISGTVSKVTNSAPVSTIDDQTKKVTGQVGINDSFGDIIQKEADNGMFGGAKYAGGEASNAWKTSVNDPLNNAANAAKAGAKGLWDKMQGMYNDAQNGLKVGGPGGGGGGAFPMVNAPGGMPGTGGVPASQSPWGITANPGMAGVGNDPFRQGQMTLMDQLTLQAGGLGPSIAGNQMRQGQEAALANNLAMANSARGGANPMMARQALQQNAQQGGQMATDMANLRLQEQMQAQNMLAGVAGAGRQGDTSQNQLAVEAQAKQAGIQQAYADLQSKYAAMGLDAQKANQAAMLEMQKLQQDDSLGWANLGLQSQIAQNALLGNTLQGVGGAMAGIGSMFSDKRLKKDVKKADKEISAFLDAIRPASYSYKDEKHGKGRFVSPMAQDLLKTPIGRSFVEEKPEGLAVNYGAGLGAILAAQATLHKRLEKLETK